MNKHVALLALLLFASAPAHAQRTVRPKEPVAELFGGFAYTRFNDAGPYTNVPGIVGSVAWNAKSWLQLVADTTYNTSTYSGTKITLYGNHYGGRVFYRERRWRISPFAEFLAGGSHINSKPTGATTAYTDLAFSFKAGGGVDYNISPHIAIRAIEADLYHTGLFGTFQNNLWLNAGVVIRFGGASPQ